MSLIQGGVCGDRRGGARNVDLEPSRLFSSIGVGDFEGVLSRKVEVVVDL